MSQQPSTSSLSSTPRPNPGDVKEFDFRFPQNQRKKYSVMQFNRNDNVNLSKWKQAKMERENNKIHYKTELDDLPKFGEGSEFGRERREVARQKKYGVIAQKYKEEDQPWILKQGGADGKTAKKYRGRKEGKINENSSYFILSQLADGTFEAYPVDSWYNFIAMQTYKTLNAEEAEEEFGRRDKTMNYFSVMVQKKLKKQDEEDVEEKTSKSKGSDLTITEDDYFLSSGEEIEDSDDEDGGGKSKSKKKGKGKGKKMAKKRPKKKDADSEAEEESDEGDFDGREFDYISEQSSDDDEMELAKTDIKGLDQELQQLEDEEDEEEEEKKDENKEASKEGDKPKDSKESKEKKSDESSSESSGSDSDIDEKNIHSAMLLQKKHGQRSKEKTPSKSGSGSHSRSQTPTVPDNIAVTDSTLSDAATKLENKDVPSKKRANPTDSPVTKRPRTESPIPGSSSNKTPSGHVPLTEEEVKRYLMRRPMTTKDLLVKLNPKRTGLPKEQIETKLAEILDKLAPEKRKKEKKIYWFIREHSK
ncbi:general transcription factor IIF subunit 1 [Strongylocentrotus purpuratus]|uniref:Transcription initiation factor IIF subunit alpha n=1 Tax=Strongylocentrotus purpuratus TaxID=7668 RepID=A0A7M7PL22_STRPU|nr:general transcription factor IIF subunit 1 [Strongylocentrotus purpuratus]